MPGSLPSLLCCQAWTEVGMSFPLSTVKEGPLPCALARPQPLPLPSPQGLGL